MDPFFALSKDHSTGKYMQRGALSQYWESMQRQYGTLKDVPRRDDPSFAKALEHRTREKEHFKSLSDENAHMHQQMQLSQQSMHNLSAEDRRLYDLISSFKEEERRAPANEASHDSGHDSGRGVFDAPSEVVQSEGDGGDRRADGCSNGGEDYSAPGTGDGPGEPAA